MLTSRLLLMVADDVPQYDIARGCHVDNANPTGLSEGLDETTKSCIRNEQSARDQLKAQWSQFASSDRDLCMANETDVAGIPSSYVDLLTCLQTQRIEKKDLDDLDKK